MRQRASFFYPVYLTSFLGVKDYNTEILTIYHLQQNNENITQPTITWIKKGVLQVKYKPLKFEIVSYKPILCSMARGITSFNKDCKSLSDLGEIRIIKAFRLLFTEHFKLNLSVRTLVKSSTS